MNIQLYTSNRMEVLADIAAEMLRPPLSSPLTQEVIMVPNRGMERWLSTQLADRLGVWANARFLLPNGFADELFRRVFPSVPGMTRLFDPEFLTWKIMSLLAADLAGEKAFTPLARYLAGHKTVGRFQLSAAIADTFDQYMIYRPEMVLTWEKAGASAEWQVMLWRALITSMDVPHRARLWENFLSSIASLDATLLPERVTAFGLSSLPPFHTALLAAVASRVPTRLFVLNPCAEYWDDLVSEREAGRIMRKELREKDNPAITPADRLHLEPGNPLLAALGSYGSDFLSQLHDIEVEETALPQSPEGHSLLGLVQSDMLYLCNRGAGSKRVAIEASDRSIQVHSCHSPLREVEVLYDSLLGLFEERKDLNPSDILVMTPDIQTYVPFVRAVFGAPESARLALPYAITDVTMKSENRAAETFLTILALPGSRFGAAAVMSILETAEVRAAFGIDESEIPLLGRWVRESGIRWGLDAATLGENALPEGAQENTWETGLDRLVLGYALPSGGRLFNGTAGVDGIEGNNALLAGKLAAFIAVIKTFAEEVYRKPERTLSQWTDLLLLLFDRVFAFGTSDAAVDAAKLRASIHSLKEPETLHLFDGAVDAATIIRFLGAKIGRVYAGAPFMCGPVTFCAMMPMRSIPFRIVCCIGMNDGAFPRTSYRPSWDMIGGTPRKGDRSLEREDRYLFLEAILSAREMLYISYRGRSVRDNTVCRPSAVVEELLRYIDSAFSVAGVVEDKPSLRTSLTIDHPLQAWDRRYFDRSDRRLFSFSPANAAVAHAASREAGEAGQHAGFCEVSLPPPPIEFSEVSLAALTAFFRHPPKFFLNRRLSMTLEEQEEQLEETEPFELSGLERYRVGQELARRYLYQADESELFTLLRAMGRLPHANPGRYCFNTLAREVGDFLAPVRTFLSHQQPLAPAFVERRIGAFLLHGAIENLYSAGRTAFRCARIKAKDYLSLWIYHLALNALAPPELPKKSVLFARDGVWHLEPLENGLDELAKLLSLYERGLLRPLQFFPESSFVYADCVVRKKRPHEYGLAKAHALWDSGEWSGNESDDPYYAFCFKNGLVLGEEFVRCTLDVWSPLFLHLKESTEGGADR
jgi:exodeoxyribonuclease V gamma subunit